MLLPLAVRREHAARPMQASQKKSWPSPNVGKKSRAKKCHLESTKPPHTNFQLTTRPKAREMLQHRQSLKGSESASLLKTAFLNKRADSRRWHSGSKGTSQKRPTKQPTLNTRSRSRLAPKDPYRQTAEPPALLQSKQAT